MISPYSELAVLGMKWLPTALAALTWWPMIIKSLPQAVYYQQSGTTIVVSSVHRQLLNQWIALIQRHLPSFAPKVEESSQVTCYVNNEAHLNPRELLSALGDYLIKRGVCWYKKTIQEMSPYSLITEDKQSHFDWVIDCRGLGSKAVVPSLRGVRGEMLLLEAPHIHLHCAVRSLHPIYSCYIVPQGQNCYMVGATHMESESEAPIYTKSVMSLLTGATLIEPGFKDAYLIDARVGLRPTTHNHLPYIRKNPGLIEVNGLFRHGFLLAPAIVAELVAGLGE